MRESDRDKSERSHGPLMCHDVDFDSYFDWETECTGGSEQRSNMISFKFDGSLDAC